MPEDHDVATAPDTHGSSGQEPPASSAGGFLVMVVICTVMWAVWNESFTLTMLSQGLILSVLALIITNRYLLKARYQDVFRISPLVLLRYVLVLLVAIFQSGFHAMRLTITGRIDVRVLDLPTDISNPFHGVLVANAITLTPGTVTIDHHAGTFKVICIENPADDPVRAGEIIKGRFERVFADRSSA